MAASVSFKRPPVVETVLSVQFDRLRGLTNAHLGAFWQQRKSHWPQINDAPRLDEQFETFGRQQGWHNGIHLKLTQASAARIQMRNTGGDRMIQLQNCRLGYNWIGKPGEKYPRYSNVRPEFDKALSDFKKFVTDNELGKITPNQWEVTYVNYIYKDTVWKEPEEWSTLFKSFPGPVIVPAGTRFEGFGGHWHFEIKDNRGRLHVELKHSHVGTPEKKEALVMKLTARGPIDKEQDSTDAIDSGLNLGHDIIVQSFEELTSQKAHDYWNRETPDDNHDGNG